MSKPMEVADASFDVEVLQSDKPVIVDFWAPWCGPCKMIAPILDEIARDMGDKVKVAKIDVDANSRTAQRYNIMSIPALFFFKNGEVIDKIVGAVPKSQIVSRLEKALA